MRILSKAIEQMKSIHTVLQFYLHLLTLTKNEMRILSMEIEHIYETDFTVDRRIETDRNV